MYAEPVGKLLTNLHAGFVIQKSALCQQLREIQSEAAVSHIVLKRDVCSESHCLSFSIT